jgi:hydrogen cyanide synthase HcnC
MTRYDAIVIGGGLVGSAIAYGLAREGLRVALVDEGDVAYRASRGNFGLVWVQSKGDGAPHYQRWTRRSADQWPALAAELSARTGISVGHERPGGVHLCLGEAELDERRARWSACGSNPAISASSTACSTAANSPTCCLASDRP